MSTRKLEKRQQDLLRKIRSIGPVFRGSVAQVHLTCGKKRCRCQKGQRHRALYASYRRGGKTHVVHVPAECVGQARAQQEKWHELKALLEQLAHVQASLWKEVCREKKAPKGKRGVKKGEGKGC